VYESVRAKGGFEGGVDSRRFRFRLGCDCVVDSVGVCVSVGVVAVVVVVARADFILGRTG
jgi:hypothetical protein